jgi:primosomal protein N' (replication factor Y)
LFAEIIINSNARALNRIFDYIIPESMENEVKVGSRIFVPFGNGKKIEDGFVIGIKETSEFANKEIARVDQKESLTEFNIQLAKLMSRKYFCNISDCIKLMLPPGTSSKEEENRIKEKTGNFVYLKKSAEEINKELELNQIKSEKQQRALKFLLKNGNNNLDNKEINIDDINSQDKNNCNFKVDNHVDSINNIDNTHKFDNIGNLDNIENNNTNGIYITDLEDLADVSKAVLQTLAKNGYIEFREEQIKRNPFINKNITRDTAKILNEEQQKCYEGIKFCIENSEYSSNLIFGITGSGKTEIYLQLIAKAIELGKTAIVLVPEISLTPQMVDRFLARFGEDKIAVLHSKLSNGERYDEWQKIKNGEVQIVIGARSAIFAPVKNLGIIIIDEEHDMSYKSDMTPRYNAKDLAKYIAEQNNCPLVLGSATPEISSFYHAKNMDIQLYKLNKRANNAKLPDIKIVDLRLELSQGNRSMISIELQNAIKENLAKKEQTILFLNRRGYSTFVMCRECGYVAKCKNCNISLTYHKYGNKLKCHYCGFEMPVMSECPECKSNKVKYFGTGTEKLEDEIKKLFPEASTIRMDIDTVGKKNSHEDILNKFRNEHIDILVGTQMIAKGHHFPNVTLVGIVSADSSLNLEDYKAVEKTFQTIVQVSGRAGRESKPGRVLIQTYNPDHYAITLAQKQDYELFYNAEVDLRKRLKYPPFCDIILIRLVGKNISEIQNVSQRMYMVLDKVLDKTQVVLYKPVPSPVDKIQNKYRWRIILKGKVNGKLLDCIKYSMKEEFTGKIKDTTITVDINPNNMN